MRLSLRLLCILLMLAFLPCAARAEEEKRVALTLDDGPSAATELLLDGLRERGVSVTFFLCGYRIRERPDAVRRMAQDGHELGVHGDSHAYFTTMPEKALRRELEDTAGAILQLTGVPPTLVRPPGGLSNEKVLSVCADEGLRVIHWSVDPCDWDRSVRDKTVARVLKAAKDGDVILLHDLNKTTAKNVLALIDALRARGFSFRTVSALAAERSVTLLPGKRYSRFPLQSEGAPPARRSGTTQGKPSFVKRGWRGAPGDLTATAARRRIRSAACGNKKRTPLNS